MERASEVQPEIGSPRAGKLRSKKGLVKVKPSPNPVRKFQFRDSSISARPKPSICWTEPNLKPEPFHPRLGSAPELAAWIVQPEAEPDDCRRLQPSELCSRLRYMQFALLLG